MIDCFPDINRRIGSGMDRTAQTNLLLELAEPRVILEHLYRYLQNDPVAQSRIVAYATHAAATPVAKELDEELEGLCIAREHRRQRGHDFSDLDLQIADHKRRLRQRPTLQPEQILVGRYKLLEPIGQGGFARIWQAFDRRLECLVAVRILHSDWVHEEQRVTRFLRGARWMQKLQHQHIARVVGEPGCHSGFHFFAIEYLPGGSLDRAILTGTLSKEQALQAVLDVGSALEYMHEHGLVHRDVKPSNILLDNERRARLTDFDLVLAADSPDTRTGPIGTLIYAAPEALEDAQSADQRIDVYSLGMTAAFVYRGRQPAITKLYDPQSIIKSLDCPESVRGVLYKAVALNADERFLSVRAFCEELRSALAGVTRAVGEPAAAPVRNVRGSALRHHPGGGILRGAQAVVVAALTLSSELAPEHGESPLHGPQPDTTIAAVWPPQAVPPDALLPGHPGPRLDRDAAPLGESANNAKGSPDHARVKFPLRTRRPQSEKFAHPVTPDPSPPTVAKEHKHVPHPLIEN